MNVPPQETPSIAEQKAAGTWDFYKGMGSWEKDIDSDWREALVKPLPNYPEGTKYYMSRAGGMPWRDAR